MPEFALPRTHVVVRLQLTHGAPRTGEIFLFERVPQHSGPETPLEMLNRPEGFSPFRADGKSAVLLVTKAHTVLLSVPHAASISDPDRLSAARTIRLDVMLANGSTLAGVGAVQAPEYQARPLHYFNAPPEPFFLLSAPHPPHHRNPPHVLC